MITAAEARRRLLAEHQQLRLRIARCLELSARRASDEVVEGALADALSGLSEAFLAHNRSEVALLSGLLGAGGDVGPLRIARMVEEHAAEHAVLRSLLLDAAHERWTRLEDVLEEMEAHMQAEERTFLSAAVLGEDSRR